MSDDLSPLLKRVCDGAVLTGAEVESAIGTLLAGNADPVQTAGFLVALKMRGESPTEIAGAARAMRAAATRIDAPDDVVDTCGTGGDGADTVNISTATAIVLAASGVPVAKHGNKGVSSASGSSDVFAALGVDVAAGPARAEAALREIGLCFLFAPNHHPAMKHVAPIRAKLGVRTLFNLLGPLTNPAGAKRQLLGVYARHLVRPIAETLADLGTVSALVVHGEDGLDELTVSTTTHVAEVRHGQITEYTISPEHAGLSFHPLEALKGGSPIDNARALERVLAGEPGAYRDAVVLNTAGGLIVSGRYDDWQDAARHAEASIDSGAARTLLERLVTFTGASS